MKTISLFDDIIKSHEIVEMELDPAMLEGLDKKVKELNDQYAVKANNSLISASYVYLNR